MRGKVFQKKKSFVTFSYDAPSMRYSLFTGSQSDQAMRESGRGKRRCGLAVAGISYYCENRGS